MLGHVVSTASKPRMPRLFTVLAVALVPLLACAQNVPRAYAYYALEPVDIGLAASSVDIEKGSSQTVPCSISPESERQLPGCGMLECPQGCGTLVNPKTGEKGGCQNSEGWCTCAGETYATYTTKVTLSSSAPSVARASYSGGAIKVKGYSAGTATITVKATLSKHLDAKETFTVHVTEKAEEPADDLGCEPDASDTESKGSESPGASSKPSGSGASGSSSASSSGKSSTSSSSSSRASASKSSSAKSSTGTSPVVSSKGKSSSGKSSSAKSSSSKNGTSGSKKSSGSNVSAVSVSSASSERKTSSAASVSVTGGAAKRVDDGRADSVKTDSEDKPADAEEPDVAQPEQALADDSVQDVHYEAAAAVSAVDTPAVQQGPGGVAVAGAVCAAAAIAAAAGFVRFRNWRRQRAPLSAEASGATGTDSDGDGGGSGEGVGE